MSDHDPDSGNKQPLRRNLAPAIDILPGADNNDISHNVFTGYDTVVRVAGRNLKFQHNTVTAPAIAALTEGLAGILGARNPMTIEDAVQVVERYNRPGAAITSPEVLAQESGVDRWLDRGANMASILERIQTWATSPMIIAAFKSLIG